MLKWAFVGDLQIPFHDKRAVEVFFKAMKAWKPHAIDVVGDIDDQLEYSTYSDGRTDEFFNQLKRAQKSEEESDEAFIKRTNPLPIIKEHAEGARQFYTDLRTQHKRADIHASLGNHDIRVFNYVDKKAPDYLEEITPNMLWSLDDLGITWRMYSERPFERFAGIHVHHGTTTTETGLAVKGDIEKYGVSLVRGHDHKGGVVYKSYPMPGRGLVGMGTGHLCDIDAYGLKYADNPAWQMGFGIGYVVENKAHLHFGPIRDYMCVIDGKVFAA